MSLPALLLTALCLLACSGLVAAEKRHREFARRVFKIGASTAFVGLAIALGATDSAYGRLVLLALGLGWAGDACLLARRGKLFLAGLGFFLLSHIAYAAAFAGGLRDATAALLGLGLLAPVGALTLRWLWPHLSPFYRVAVGAYVLAIVAMCTLSIGWSAATGYWPVAAGALLFMASDIAVARERFVAPGFANKAWGLPAYYVAQLLLAWSIAQA